ncbi:MAG TPA: A/G-specific adenine glycosylase [Acidobacteriota bacterium]|nr:A/G-specific adenine glycosylase [Acidobacteriota bacterium]
MTSVELKAELAPPLLDWYPKARRDLPWRANPDPYWVWLSEIMLQQTQIKTALPYFERFLEAFPDIQSLASADINRVLSLWSGLGYYRRARNLHKAAGVICQKHGGRFPRSHQEVLALPGIGRYTAGAICSIAFNQPHPIVDGNVRRVMARYLAIEEELKGKALEDLWDRLQECVEARQVAPRVSYFNQALMELGALVCTPRSPDCPNCPLQASCRGYARGLVEELPVKSKRREVEEFHFLVAVARRRGKFLLHRDDEAPFLKGFWEFPRVALPRGRRTSDPARAQEGGPSSTQRPAANKRSLTSDAGAVGQSLTNPASVDGDLSLFDDQHNLRLERIGMLTPVRHQITFRKLHFHPLAVRLRGPLPEGRYAWARLNEPDYPVPAYVTKIESAARLLF